MRDHSSLWNILFAAIIQSLLLRCFLFFTRNLLSARGSSSSHGTEVQSLREVHARGHLLLVRARVLLVLEVLERNIVRLVADLIHV